MTDIFIMNKKEKTWWNSSLKIPKWTSVMTNVFSQYYKMGQKVHVYRNLNIRRPWTASGDREGLVEGLLLEEIPPGFSKAMFDLAIFDSNNFYKKTVSSLSVVKYGKKRAFYGHSCIERV